MSGDHEQEKIIKFFEKRNLAFVNLSGYPFALNLFHCSKSELLCEFRFGTEVNGMVRAFHNHLCKTNPKTHKSHSQICLLVGIHVRRTDYKKWLAMRAKQGLVDEYFFLSAMQLTLDKIEQQSLHQLGSTDATTNMTRGDRKSPRVIFVVASDDPSWCKDKFSHFTDLKQSGNTNLTIIYTEDHYLMVRQSGVALTTRSKWKNSTVENAHFDLAVMASMNYSIFDYGTYGFWGAYLSHSKHTIGADVNTFLKDKVIEAGVEGFIFL